VVSPMVEAGRVYLLEGAGWVENFLFSVTAFPRATHDEAVDCLYMMLQSRVREDDSALLSWKSV